MTRPLVVKVTHGDGEVVERERCAQGFSVAAAAVAAGAEVSLWLTGDAVWLAVPGRAEKFVLQGSPPLAELLALVLESGQVTACTQCLGRRFLQEADLVPGVRVAGSATFVDEVLRADAQALVY